LINLHLKSLRVEELITIDDKEFNNFMAVGKKEFK